MSQPEVAIPSLIHPATRLGYVALTVADLSRSLRFYEDLLGFTVHDKQSDYAVLGAGREALLTLTERPNARRVRGTTGLYHFAILTPSRVALAQSLRRLLEANVRVGGGDHLVSEAVYLSDPDGNGIELYRDRPRSEWRYTDGQIAMDTLALDFEGILRELEREPAAWSGLHPDTILGHMHLHVAHLAEAEAFYRDVIGFGLMAHYGDAAAFLSAGGYHHHLGINTWAGVGAATPPEDAVGLRYYVVRLPNEDEHLALIGRLEAAGVRYEQDADELLVRDPSGNALRFVVG